MNTLRITLIFLCCTCLWLGLLHGQADVQETLQKRGEARLEIIDIQRFLTWEKRHHCSIDHGSRSDRLFAYVDASAFKALHATDIAYRHAPIHVERNALRMMDVDEWTSSNQDICSTTWDFYPTYELYEHLMQSFAQRFPGLTRLDTFGTLASTRRLLAIRISDHPDREEDEPRFLYSSTMHGDETAGYVIMLRFIAHMLCGYDSDARLEDMVNEIDLWINPLANPDGMYMGGNHTIADARRSNHQGADLNRNYPDPEDGIHPDGRVYQEETEAFMDFGEKHRFNMSCNIHSGAEVASYPWDTWEKRHADDAWWIHVCRAYADAAQEASAGQYFTALNNGIVNGFDWYEVRGGRQDYTTHFLRGREMTLEISWQKLLPSERLPEIWSYSKESLLGYLQQSLYGVRGIVTDRSNGEPIQARIWVEGHDRDSSHVWTQMPIGNYHRYLKAGIYTLRFTAEGYDDEVRTIEVVDDQSLRLDVTMGGHITSTNDVDVSDLRLSVYPTMALETIVVTAPDRSSVVLLQITDALGRRYLEEIWDVTEDRRAIDVSGLSSGTYILTGIDEQSNHTSTRFFKH